MKLIHSNIINKYEVNSKLDILELATEYNTDKGWLYMFSKNTSMGKQTFVVLKNNFVILAPFSYNSCVDELTKEFYFQTEQQCLDVINEFKKGDYIQLSSSFIREPKLYIGLVKNHIMNPETHMAYVRTFEKEMYEKSS